MSNASGSGPANGENGKSIKDQNRWQLWAIVAVNSLFLYGVAQANAVKVDGLRAAFTDAQNLIPVGFALIIATVFNGLTSAETKARLVFLRWNHALPGHRAFSRYAVCDPRVDIAALEKVHGSSLPVDPVEQNRAWYRLYKMMENDNAVRQVHRDFLLMRDYTGLCAVFIVLYGAVGVYVIASTTISLTYLLVLLVQYLLVRKAACNYGIRLVTTVLARRAAKEIPDAPKVPKKRTRSKALTDPAKEGANSRGLTNSPDGQNAQ